MITNSFKKLGSWDYLQLGLFVAGIIILCIPIFSMDYLINLDGPNHLYSSKIFYKLLGNNDFYKSYFDVNSNFTPNYFTVLLLGGLQQIFSGVISLKIFHLLHIILLLWGAFYWSNSNNDKKIIFPFLVFPFAYSYLFFSGFYNFIFAVSISFFVMGAYERFSQKGWNIRSYIIIGILLFLTYCSHIIPFFFSGVYLSIDTLLELRKSKWNSSKLKHALFLFVAALPGVLLTFIFMGGHDSEYSYLEFSELLSRITSGFSITIKNDSAEGQIMINWIKLAYLAFALMLFLYKSFSLKKDSNWNFTITALAILLLYFILPDSVGYASVFSVRIEYIFWLFVAIGSSKFVIENKLLATTPAILGIGLLIFQINSNLPFWQVLNGHAKSVFSASEHIEENSIVYPVFNSLIWDDYHVSNIAGTEKNMVILENTSARQDYFPLIYKSPYEDCLKEQRSDDYTCGNQNIKIDYLLIIGKYILEDPLAIELYSKAFNQGEVVYEDDFVQLLKFPTHQN